MMKIRTALAVIVCGLLAFGYAVSQVAFFGQWAPLYRERVDVPAIRLLALSVVALLVLAPLLRSPEEPKQP